MLINKKREKNLLTQEYSLKKTYLHKMSLENKKVLWI